MTPSDVAVIKKFQDEVGKLGIFSLLQLYWLWIYVGGTTPLAKAMYFAGPLLFIQLMSIFAAIGALAGGPCKSKWARRQVLKLRIIAVLCILPAVGFVFGLGTYWMLRRELRADAKRPQEVLPEPLS